MKAALVAILFAAPALAQTSEPSRSPRDVAAAACGPKNVKFEVKQDTPPDPAQPTPGKALVYMIEDLGQCPDCVGLRGSLTDVADALTRVGMDGTWVGANQGNSYFFFAVDPGEHHLCINWQSRLELRSHAFAMANFTAEEGKIYYFRERLFPGENDYFLDLDPVNSDQGKYLVAISAFSTSRAKK